MSVGPFWRYYGGKWRAAVRYPEPQHRQIIEPFAGAAGYACRYPDCDVLLIDRDPVIIAIWQYLISATPADVLNIGDIPDGGTVDDLDAPQAARWLAGFWCNAGVPRPRKRPSIWAQASGGWSQWARARIAADVPRIKHWRAICADYTAAPDVPATWFIDPPYQGRAGRHYRCNAVDYCALGHWTKQRQGLVIACEQAGATWLPWSKQLAVKGTRGTSREVVYIRDDLELWSIQRS